MLAGKVIGVALEERAQPAMDRGLDLGNGWQVLDLSEPCFQRFLLLAELASQ